MTVASFELDRACVRNPDRLGRLMNSLSGTFWPCLSVGHAGGLGVLVAIANDDAIGRARLTPAVANGIRLIVRGVVAATVLGLLTTKAVPRKVSLTTL